MITTTFPALLRVSNAVRCAVPLEITLAYDEENDPLAVQMIITVPSNPEEPDNVWRFARDLLRIGVESFDPVGSGDIKFQRENPRNGGTDGFIVCLSSRTEHADLQLPYRRVAAFLNETLALAEPGTESLDSHVDELLEEILGS